MDKSKLQYMVGGLLYVPALNIGIAKKIINGTIPCLTSVCLCLEDSICDEALKEAEITLCSTLKKLADSRIPTEKLPLIFIRIRSPRHLRKIHYILRAYHSIITGYILPKFDLSNCGEYKSIVCEINSNSEKPFYIMPILESEMIACIKNGTDVLLEIKKLLDSINRFVLNIRVGGNDLCNLYGVRRSKTENIYQIGTVRNILTAILSIFSSDYTVSGPVWEYFGSDLSEPWADGLRAELTLDRLNGFIGKTAIHPSQLPLIYESMQVKKSDYEDALSILGWNSSRLGVEKSADGFRMNEVKCHTRWAEKTAALGEIYGVKS